MMAWPGEVLDTSNLATEEIQFAVDGVNIEAYLARPKAPGHYPAVIVIHEAFGPVPHILDVARRFASLGYVAMAPNLYSRVGAPNASHHDEVFNKMFSLSDPQIVRDLEGAVAYLRQLEYSTGKVGMIGFCSGGRQTLLMAAQSTMIDAAVDCWGGFIRTATPTEETSPTRPTPIINLVEKIRCPILVVIGEEDQNPSPADGALLEERLMQAKVPHEVKIYHDAGHAFFADYRPNYREKPAFELWDDVKRFFGNYL